MDLAQATRATTPPIPKPATQALVLAPEATTPTPTPATRALELAQATTPPTPTLVTLGLATRATTHPTQTVAMVVLDMVALAQALGTTLTTTAAQLA